MFLSGGFQHHLFGVTMKGECFWVSPEGSKAEPLVFPDPQVILGVPSMSILSSDPNLSRKPPETQGEKQQSRFFFGKSAA